MEKAAQELKEKDGCSANDMHQCAVSFDGTWQRRGYASHHGVVTSILVEIGKCVDIEVLSNICQACSLWEIKDKNCEEFQRWKLHHSCKANHSGSSSSMEPVGATRIFQRSEQTRGLQYVQYLGDGDSASFKKVCESKPYDGVDIEKLECVGHVQKRCGSRLRRLKQDNRGKKLSDGKGLSGAGRLTEKVMNTLQNYYGCAIRQNTGSLEDMRKSVSAILPHVASSANNLLHHSCPDGDNSWCGYKQNPSTYKHKKGLPLPVIKIVEPIFKDLASTNLLSKCLHGKTQNANECLYKIVWDRCSKEYFVERDVVKEAAYSAVSHFNDGRIAILKVFESLHITPGRFTNFLCSAQDNRRISKSLIYMFK